MSENGSMTLNVKKRAKVEEQMDIADIPGADVESFAANAETEQTKAQEKKKSSPPAKSKKAPKSEPKKPKVQAKPKPKVVRDTFSFPEDDYALIEAVKVKMAKRGKILNKSEIIRAGLHALKKMKVADLDVAAEAIDKVKTGRPSS